MKNRYQNGFTLYELLITLLIVGVVLTFGVPNLTEFTRNSRITTTANDLHAAFQMARSEAARAKTNITICGSADPFSAGADCDGTLDQGFIVFMDDNGDLLRNGANETVLRAHAAPDDTVTLAVANGATYFSYASTGMGRGDVNGNPAISQIIVCDDRGTGEASAGYSQGRLFVATPLGRATIVRDLTAVQNALGNMGLACP
ncbi:MAG: GspH/FimT family pseudopilin [Woeseiaceae bacterium]